MKILLTGKNGQLGWELLRALQPLGEVNGVDFLEVDLTNSGDVVRLVDDFQPQIIVNAAAYTAVDRAESQPDLAFAVNERSVRLLAELANRRRAAFIHYSTDYVYDGCKGSPYVEEDLPNPLNVYGQSKLAGDLAIQQVGGAHLILRTSWVYSQRQGGFLRKVLQWAREQTHLRMVTDQVGNPTWCRMLAEATAMLVARSGNDPYEWFGARRGLYHLAGSGCTSRYEWAQMILDLDPHPEEHTAQHFEPALTRDFPNPAQRPLFSALDCARFEQVFDLALPPWQAALRMAMEA